MHVCQWSLRHSWTLAPRQNTNWAKTRLLTSCSTLKTSPTTRIGLRGTTLTSLECLLSVTRTWVRTWLSSLASTWASSTACRRCTRSTPTSSNTRTRSWRRYRKTNSHADRGYAANWSRSSTPCPWPAENRPITASACRQPAPVWPINTPFLTTLWRRDFFRPLMFLSLQTHGAAAHRRDRGVCKRTGIGFIFFPSELPSQARHNQIKPALQPQWIRT